MSTSPADHLVKLRRKLLFGWWALLLVSVSLSFTACVVWLHTRPSPEGFADLTVGYLFVGMPYLGMLHLTLMLSVFRSSHPRWFVVLMIPLNAFVIFVAAAFTWMTIGQLADQQGIEFSWAVNAPVCVFMAGSALALSLFGGYIDERPVRQRARSLRRSSWMFVYVCMAAVTVPNTTSLFIDTPSEFMANTVTARVVGVVFFIGVALQASYFGVRSLHLKTHTPTAADTSIIRGLMMLLVTLGVVFSSYGIPVTFSTMTRRAGASIAVSMSISVPVSVVLVILLMAAVTACVRVNDCVLDVEDDERERQQLEERKRVIEPSPPAHTTPVQVRVFTPSVPVRSKRALADERRRRRVAAATIPGQEPSRDFIQELREGTCVYCGRCADHADHIRPIARGGWHHPDNLVSACQTCNITKNSYLLVEWMRERPDLVLHGCLTSPKVLAAYACEMREMPPRTVIIDVPPAQDAVRAACEKYGLPELVQKARTVEFTIPHTPSPLRVGVPMAPIDSDDTHPELDAGAAKQWAAHRKRLTNEKSKKIPPLSLTQVWKVWSPETVDARLAALVAEQGSDAYTLPIRTCIDMGV